MTYDEHIAWCKKRALEYLERGNVQEAFTSMLSDLSKHPETKIHVGSEIGVGMMLIPGWINNPVEVRRWIEGFR
jgi:hypothetical protein